MWSGACWIDRVRRSTLIDTGITSWGYSGLDIFAKYVFAFLLLRWVGNNESVVSSNEPVLG